LEQVGCHEPFLDVSNKLRIYYRLQKYKYRLL